MNDQFARTKVLLGEAGVAKLQGKKVAVVGLGGVGSFAAETLARAGVGNLILVDHDNLELTNLNRQIFALHSTLGQAKVNAARARILDINPDILVKTHKFFVGEDTSPEIFSTCDFIIDAIDTVSGKLALVKIARDLGVPIISCMGTANRLDPTKLTVGDVFSTSGCPLCRVMRRELRKMATKGLRVVFSTEAPVKTPGKALGSVPFVPPVAAFLLVAEVIKKMISD